MTAHDWGIFGAFALMLFGVSLFSPHIAGVIGLGVITVIVVQHPNFFLGAIPNQGQPGA